MSHCLEYGLIVAVAVASFSASAVAQDTASAATMVHVMAQAVPVFTRATPTAEGRSLSEGYLSQPMLMFGATRGRLFGTGTLNFEGLTMARGELTTGAHGEGYVDRRHPHTYLHEAVVGAAYSWGSVSTSLSAGRGFAPFGSDDPMVRPFQKYPANHHLSQILERLVVIAAVRRGSLVLEGSAFNGDEPVSAGSEPRYDRFGDSWAGRLTWTPSGIRDTPLELSASLADVVSPESAAGGGLDQKKRSVVARWRQASLDREHYMLAEWAGTEMRSTFGRPAGDYQSWLVETSVCRGGPTLAARLERTDRPEEERLVNAFRSPNPPNDNSTHGVTRWTTATISLSASRRLGVVLAKPFVEIAVAAPRALAAGSVFDPLAFYQSDRLWMLSAGTRFSVGRGHERMGRYGVALAAAPEGQDHATMGHAMHGGVVSPMNSPGDRCAR